MVHKRYKLLAATKLLQKEVNIYFINPQTNKLNLNLFSKYLKEKDHNTNLELEIDFLDDNNYSDNQFITYFGSQSNTNTESSYSDENQKAVIKRRKTRPGTHNIDIYNSIRIKAKQYHSLWFYFM